MLDLRLDAPVYVVVGLRDRNNLMPYTSKASLAHYPDLAQFVSESYGLETTIGGFELWRRRAPGQGRRPGRGAGRRRR